MRKYLIYIFSLIFALSFFTTDTSFAAKKLAFATVNGYDIPEFSGDAVYEVNDNKPFFTKKEIKKGKMSFEKYKKLDSLKRCGVCFASIGEDLMPTEARGTIGSVKPTGWHTVKYNGYVEGNYLYNRCHLIGFQLSGENANKKNLITGTRYMNVIGQLPYENLVADYISETGNHVLYRVTPVFSGKDLVARGVLMEAYSVEDKGKGVKFCIFCYNVQPGIYIDYSDGSSYLIEDYTGEYVTSGYKENGGLKADNKTDKKKSGDVKYVLNTKTKKFHKPDCKSVKDIKKENREDTSLSRKEIISAGYDPCKNCNP